MSDDGTSIATINGGAGSAYLNLNRSSTSYQAGVQWQSAGTGKWYNYIQSGVEDGKLRWYSNADRMTLQTDGNLGVGTISPAYPLDVNGNAHATSFPASSDVRFKKNIKPISGALQKIMSLRGVTYEWNEFVNNTRDGYTLNTPIIGFIAQELEKVIPELVSTWKFSEECQDARAIDYPRLTAMLTEAIKEQQNQINNLKNRVYALENK